MKTELALVGYRSRNDHVRIIYNCTLGSRVELWRAGYKVDAIPISDAKEMEALDAAAAEFESKEK